MSLGTKISILTSKTNRISAIIAMLINLKINKTKEVQTISMPSKYRIFRILQDSNKASRQNKEDNTENGLQTQKQFLLQSALNFDYYFVLPKNSLHI